MLWYDNKSNWKTLSTELIPSLQWIALPTLEQLKSDKYKHFKSDSC